MSRHEGIPLEHAEVKLVSKQNFVVRRPEDPRERRLRIVLIRRDVRVWGPIDTEQTDRLLWAAANCPVARSIGDGIRIIDRIEHVGPDPAWRSDPRLESWREEVEEV